MPEVLSTLESDLSTIDFLKIGNAVFRVVSDTAIEPIVAIEKHVEENPFLDKLITGTEANQLHFGLEYLKEEGFQPSTAQKNLVDTFRSLGLLTVIQGVTLLDCKESLTTDIPDALNIIGRHIKEADALFDTTTS